MYLKDLNELCLYTEVYTELASLILTFSLSTILQLETFNSLLESLIFQGGRSKKK